jgi:hypothetical protein
LWGAKIVSTFPEWDGLQAKPDFRHPHDLRGHERLRTDQDHREHDREPKQPNRETDRELVEADADAEPEQRQTPAARRQANPLTKSVQNARQF